MRILIGTTPLPGHVNPFTTLAKALLGAGHEVLWYTGHSFADQVTALGATFLPFDQALEYDTQALNTIFPKRRQYQGLDHIKFDLRKIFIDNLEGQTVDLLALCRDHQPDVVLSDTGLLGAIATCSHLQLPLAICNVTALMVSDPTIAPFGFGRLPNNSYLGRLQNRFLYWFCETFVLADIHQAVNEILTALRMSPLNYALFDVPIYMPDLFLQPTTPRFEYPRSNLPNACHFIGPIFPTFPSPFDPPAWWPELTTNRPVVLVTQGTMTTEPQQLILPTIQALANEDVLVIVTTANRAVSELGPLPSNVRAEPFIPYNRLLPQLDLIVTNGGYGTVQMALAHGVPLVVAGKTEEKAEIGARVTWAEVGLDLKTNYPKPRQIRRAVSHILNAPKYKRNAQYVACDMAGYDAPQQTVALIEQLVNHRASTPISESHIV
ncbi:MAG: glycosyltransferase [Chloroflexota bacterium]